MSETKEAIYDTRIFPLMAEIIKVCNERGISMVASFELDADDDPANPLLCTTMLVSRETRSEALRKASNVLYPQPIHALAETIETMPDGTKHVTIARIR